MITIFKIFMNFVYMFIKLFKTKEKVTIISRQKNNMTTEIRLLYEGLINEKIDTIVITKKLEKNIKSLIVNFFLFFKQMYHIATSSVLVVDGYCIMASILKHKKNLTIIQIWHANAIVKKIGLQTVNSRTKINKMIAKLMRMHKNYDYVLSSSLETSKVYEEAFGVRTEQVLLTGTPILDYLYNKEYDKSKEIRKKYKLKKKVVLYVPTFRKDKGIDYEKIINNFNLKDYDLVISLHPVDSKTNLNKKAKILEGYTSEELLSIADVVISDYSNIAFLAGLLKKQLYFYVFDIDDYKNYPGLNIDLLKEYSEYSKKDIKEIFNLIKNKDYDFDYLSKFVNKYISLYDGDCVKRIVSVIKDNMKTL